MHMTVLFLNPGKTGKKRECLTTTTARRTDAGNAASGFQAISSGGIALKTARLGCGRTVHLVASFTSAYLRVKNNMFSVVTTCSSSVVEASIHTILTRMPRMRSHLQSVNSLKPVGIFPSFRITPSSAKDLAIVESDVYGTWNKCP